MNLELLFHSANLTGNSTLRQIAISHTDLTMRNHIRGDGEIAVNNSKLLSLNSILVLPGSTWHVVDYNETTGRVIRKRTAQGYSDNSTWARGQAWAIYGFANSEAIEIHFYLHLVTMTSYEVYRLTATAEYLETARRLATYFVNNLPQGGIVPWFAICYPSFFTVLTIKILIQGL